MGQPEIKQAYKQLAQKYHPDLSPPGKIEEYTKMFIRVKKAYETLSDPKTRALYDMDMSKGLHSVFSGRKVDRISRKSTSEWRNQLSELERRSKVKTSRYRNSNVM